MTYRFGPFTFDGLKLRKDGIVVEDLQNQHIEALRILVEWAESQPGVYVNKAEMIKELFADPDHPGQVTVNDPRRSLTVAVSPLRLALGLRPDGEHYITEGRYRLNEKVERVEDADDSPTGKEPQHAALAAAGADPQNSPYVGPQPFPRERSADFFGREDEVNDLVRLLTDPAARVVALYSPSGAGKTSLLNTALRVALINGGYQVLPTARVGVPTRTLTPSPGQNQYTFDAIAYMERENEAVPHQGALSWARYLSLKGVEPRSVLVIDQLEEIVTSDRSGSPRQKEEFFVELRESVARDPSLRVLLAFREEYLAQLQRLAGELSQTWKSYPLKLLQRKDCETAIKEPALRHGGVKFEDDVLQQVVAKLTTVRYVNEWGTLCEEPGEYVEPLQLQLICDTLWRNLPAGRQKISWGDLRHASRAEGSSEVVLGTEQTISRFVESVLYRFCEQAMQRASDAARRKGSIDFPESLIILGCLQFISERGMRTQVRRDKDWTGDLPNAVADGLVAHQFLRVEQRHGDRWYELAHDTLIRPVVDHADKIDDDALRDLFSSVVHDVAATPRARQEGITEVAIAQESCLIFVARDGSPLQASLTSLENASARLPLWIIEALVGRGILRMVQPHEQQAGYELTHWRMALAIHRERFVAMDRLYNARKLLATHLDLCLAADASLAVWYQNSDKILKDVEELVGVVKLSDMEARFALCASLATSYHLEDFVAQIRNKFPDVAVDVLREAVRYEPDSNVRRHAARALGLFPFERREDILLDLALGDPDESVQNSSARVLAKLENANYLERLFGLLDVPSSRASALRALAWVHDAAPSDAGLRFEERRKQLALSSRLRLRATLTGVRWKGAKGRVLVALLIALVSTILITAPPRALLATFGLTITQFAPMGLFEGAFQGVAGALTWSLFIGGSLLCWWFVGERRRPWQGRSSTLVGALGGLAGGVVNTFALILVYGHSTLAQMHWIPTEDSSQIEALTETGLALAMPLYGALVGLGVGQAARWMLPRWRRSASEWKRAPDRSEIRVVLASGINQMLICSLLILLLLVAAAIAFSAFLTMVPHQPAGYGPKLFGEALSLYFGGVGLLIGLFLGLHILRKGLHIPGDEELS
jgi:hypothetical protein